AVRPKAAKPGLAQSKAAKLAPVQSKTAKRAPNQSKAADSRTGEAKATKPAVAKGAPSDAPGSIAGIVLTNPDKILYPEAGFTKRDLARYYERVGDWILPHLAQRPLTLLRCPNGWDKPCFYQKNADKSVIEA